MANEENLTPFVKGEVNREEAAKNGRKGGVASGKARAERKKIKDTIAMMLNSSTDNNSATAKELYKLYGFKEGDSITIQDIMVAMQISKAMAGDLDATKFITEHVDGKPIQQVAHSTGEEGMPLVNVVFGSANTEESKDD